MQPAARVRQELAECSAVLEDITGVAVKFFRPPFGARRPYVLRAARELGLTPVMWNVTGYDWDPIGVEGILRESGCGDRAQPAAGSRIEPAAARRRTSGDGHGRMDTVRAVDRLLTARLVASEHGAAMRFVTVDAWARE